jgi:hypothetical protein
MPLTTRFVFVCGAFANRSPWNSLECGGLAAAFYGVTVRELRVPFDAVAHAYTVKAGARLPHSKSSTG